MTRTNHWSFLTRLPAVIGLLVLASFVLAPAEVFAQTSAKEAAAWTTAEMWPRIKGLFLTAITQMAPPEGRGWLWPFLIGTFWLLVMNKGLRSKAHWVAYITPPMSPLIPGWWLLSKIPVIGGFFKWFIDHLWTPVMGYTLKGWTIREITMGTFGCAVITGFLGGNWLYEYFGGWNLLILLPAGAFGLVTMILFLAEKAGGKAFRDKVAKAGAPGRLWMRLRHGVSEADRYKCRARNRGGRVCGHVNPITVRFCDACGTKNPRLWDCSDCGKKNLPAKSRNCPECGTERSQTPRPRDERQPTRRGDERRTTPEAETEEEATVNCPHCDAEQPEDRQFCGHCRHPLTGDARPTTAPVVTVAVSHSVRPGRRLTK